MPVHPPIEKNPPEVPAAALGSYKKEQDQLTDELRRQCDVFVELRDLGRQVARVYQDGGGQGPQRRERFRRDEEGGQRPGSTPATALEADPEGEEFEDDYEEFDDAEDDGPIVEKR
jgi:hypothetical protein